MKLRCQLKSIKCPRYKHQGIFRPNDEMVKPLLSDLHQCAACIAYAAPQRPDLEDDLFQIASLTLIEKGPKFNPAHHSGAGFGTFIRPRICGALMHEKSRELTRSTREFPSCGGTSNPYEDSDAEVNQDIGRLWEVPDPRAEFETELVRNISFNTALPKLLKMLTPREQEVFACLRTDQRNCEIAETLTLSEARVNQLVTQVTQKLTRAAQRLGLAE
ncbi:hypothetical protein C6499_06040 [Candidatus Poribacteria bacterium]|nr:MAG: hypothetical protein C6499_06040 [Candidatus Poribacteria bacterium]